MAKKEATLILRIKKQGARVLNGLKDSLRQVGVIGAAMGAAIASGLVVSIKAYREQQLSVNQLNQSLKNQGIFTKDLSAKYQTMAADLQKVTTFGDEAIISAQAQLQAYLGQKEITTELTKATLDFAAAQGVDLKVAAGLVGKAIGSSTNALSRYGIEVDASADSAKKLEQVTEALNGKFGGQAEAAAEGLGVITQLKNSFGDFLETVGAKFEPIVVSISQKLLKFTNDLQANDDVLDGLADTAEVVASGFIIMKGVFQAVGTAIGSVLGTTFGALSQALEGNFLQALETVKAGFTDTGDEIIRIQKNTNSELESVNDSFNQKVADDREKDNQDLREKLATQNEIKLEQSEINKENKEIEDLAAQEQKLLHEEAMTELENSGELQRLNNGILNAKTQEAKRKALKTKEIAIKNAENEQEKLRQTNMFKFEQFINSEKVKNLGSTLGRISSLQSSKNKEMVILGKAAAIANITISTAQGFMEAMKLGPIVGPILGGLVIAAGATSAAQVAGVQLAEGGIVRATPGGIQATIGEGGQDEAVIPLDDDAASEKLGGGNTFNFNGPIMGDRSQAREFAIAMDNELTSLRRDGESNAFDSDII